MQIVAELSVSQLKARLEKGESVFLLDVREPFEYEIANLKGQLIPLGELSARLDELDKEQEIVVYCHHGNRSRYATEFLQRQGFRSVKNLVGGIDAWVTEIDPKMPRY
ncbi:MAG: rhodanese-like domain-containing protein [Ignavibacteriales bacterium]|nr:rhodanese-like domain-containing protein [Ignavibacteriales bacterium]